MTALGLLLLPRADFVMVVGDLVAASLSWRASSFSHGGQISLDARLWKLVASVLIVLALIELFDFQTFITAAARGHAIADGWYEARRQIQLAGVFVVTALSAICGLTGLWLARASHACVRLAIIGLGLIILLGLLRTVSLHQIDAILEVAGTSANRSGIIKVTGLCIITVSAIIYAKEK